MFVILGLVRIILSWLCFSGISVEETVLEISFFLFSKDIFVEDFLVLVVVCIGYIEGGGRIGKRGVFFGFIDGGVVVLTFRGIFVFLGRFFLRILVKIFV